MYSFSYKAKLQAAQKEIGGDIENFAELSAIIHSVGAISLGKQMQIEITTEIEPLYERINKILKKFYNAYAELFTDDDNAVNKNIRYVITIPTEIAKKVLFDCEILRLDEMGNTEFVNGIENMLVMEDIAARAYIRGAFLACSTTSVTTKAQSTNGGGYHLEFVFTNEMLASDFAEILTRFDIFAKKVARKNTFVVYLKDAQSISDLLALVGADGAVLKLNEQMLMREVRNNINRQNNCLNYNMTKTVNASVDQVEAIKTIDNMVGLATLPSELYELAKARLSSPDATLTELAKNALKPISKSGIRHRMDKILKIAKDLSD